MYEAILAILQPAENPLVQSYASVMNHAVECKSEESWQAHTRQTLCVCPGAGVWCAGAASAMASAASGQQVPGESAWDPVSQGSLDDEVSRLLYPCCICVLPGLQTWPSAFRRLSLFASGLRHCTSISVVDFRPYSILD